jgi:squalene-hopene/tetraprenyl-beta-curcumene cyclase
MQGIRRLLAACGYAELSWQFELFNTHLLSGLSDLEAAPSTLLGLVFAERLPPERPVVKLDGYLPDYHPDDLASSQAVAKLAKALDIPLPSYADALCIVAPDAPLTASQCIQQYCSLDILAHPKLNIYFRPLGNECQHMGAAQRPHMKPDILSRLDTACRKAIVELDQERPSNYATSTHRMRFVRKMSLSFPSDLQRRRVFQTVVIGCALLNAARSGFQVDDERIASDIEDLADTYCQDIRCDWCYFPNLAELPADANNLAQVMQLLLLARSAHVHELCDDALELLFEQVHSDASLDTGIIYPADTSVAKQKRLQFIGSHQGNGLNPEVVANLTYALSLRGNDRFDTYARRIASILVEQQQSNGTWIATSYCEPFYGTFLGTRAVRAALPQSQVLGRTACYLWESQHADGGWGEKRSDPTSTALALNTAVLLRGFSAGGAAAVAQGAQYLLRQQLANGCWHGDTFMKMDPPRAQRRLTACSRLTYPSDTTTAFCLQSLCAARQVLEREILEDQANADISHPAGVNS